VRRQSSHPPARAKRLKIPGNVKSEFNAKAQRGEAATEGFRAKDEKAAKAKTKFLLRSLRVRRATGKSPQHATMFGDSTAKRGTQWFRD